MRQTPLNLSEEDRLVIEEIRSKGLHQAREVNRAHVLSCLDRGIPEAQIIAVLGIGRTAVWRARAAYLQGGVELAVFDVERSGRPCRYDTNAEAQVTALACSAPPKGRQRWTMVELERCRSPRTRHGHCEPGDRAAHAQKNDLKPWRRVMWCIGALTEDYRSRMYALLELYARPVNRSEPVICIDEKSLQLIGHSREPLPMASHQPTKQDYEYERNGTTNLFVAVEPKGGKRIVSVTAHRGKIDFVAFIDGLLTGVYAKARRVHLVLDNLNTHFRKCFDDVLGSRAAEKLLRRVQFHYTPKHASWLNMAEIEIGILTRQCLDRRIANRELLQTEVDAWQQARNTEQRTIEWNFTRQDADRKLGRHYVSKFTC
ncbi:MAG: IS630 family transposase [Novosphingobium sp.]|nr:IS630 family transposase [Novosphingobium sp.]